MRVGDKFYKTVWYDEKNNVVFMIDQTLLPFRFEIVELKDYRATARAIKDMVVRGAGAIGVSAGFAMAQAFVEDNSESYIKEARREIEATRPTAVNLFYATNWVFEEGAKSVKSAIDMAQYLAVEDADNCRKIGEYGNAIIKPGQRILTHCNAGWLGFVDYGSALAPVYVAHQAGKQPFVYVDETRPRGQGARLTAWELYNNQVDHRIIADNAAAYYMAKGNIDMVITGADRIAANGDTANKIGTLEKAILAKEFGIPFYVAAPLSTFDFNCPTGQDCIIEERPDEELLYHEGLDANGELTTIRMASPGSHGLNPAFDVTSARYITGFITDRGIVKPDELNML